MHQISRQHPLCGRNAPQKYPCLFCPWVLRDLHHVIGSFSQATSEDRHSWDATALVLIQFEVHIEDISTVHIYFCISVSTFLAFVLLSLPSWPLYCCLYLLGLCIVVSTFLTFVLLSLPSWPLYCCLYLLGLCIVVSTFLAFVLLSLPSCYHVVFLPCCVATMLCRYHVVILCCCHVVSLACCHIVLLPCCVASMLSYCVAAMLCCYHFVILCCCHVIFGLSLCCVVSLVVVYVLSYIYF
jgi:hypothetical protein